MPEDGLFLVGTSEVPLAAYHMDEIFDPEDLPARYAGFSTCFRREAGTYGKDTAGIFRVHQFDKVEMFVFCRPEESADEHERLLGIEEELVRELEVPYRVVNIAAGDLGASAAKKYDIEAWFPARAGTGGHVVLQHSRLEVRTAPGQDPRGGGQRGGPHAQRDRLRDRPDDPRHPGEPPAARRVGAHPGGVAEVHGLRLDRAVTQPDRVFARIARRYDRINAVLSLGRERAWRREGVRRLGPGLVLDLGCGTGATDFEGRPVVGLDPSPRCWR